MNIKENEKVMKEKCLCEACGNKKILKHFEECEVCGSEAYHSTPNKLNPSLSEPKPKNTGNPGKRRIRF